MPLTKAKGNMYDQVSHVHTHLGGECPHECHYCYVQKMGKRFPAVKEKYSGLIHLIKEELEENYGLGKSIFIEHMNDLFADKVENEWIEKILAHCNQYPDNTYVFQTKNPVRAFEFRKQFPVQTKIGTTIETNRKYYKMSKAPYPNLRLHGISYFINTGFKTFITIEPILDFDVKILAHWLIYANPDFVNIGSDSKGSDLPEPSKEKILDLILRLDSAGVHINKKPNLERLDDCPDGKVIRQK